MSAHMSLRNLYPQILKISRIPCCLCARKQQTSAELVKHKDKPLALAPGGKEIVIPRRKKRDSLSILKALASTVDHDTGSRLYHHIDDPEMLSTNSNEQKMLSLARAAGRKQARFIISEFWEAFDHDDAVPHIKAYDPDVTEYQHKEPTEEALIERIQLRRVKDAIEVEENMNRLGVEASQSVLQSLLELVCVYNHTDPISIHPEENSYMFGETYPAWKKNCYAEGLFERLPEKTADAYNTLVRGMLVHSSKKSDYAMHLYTVMKEKKMPVYKDTYIQLLRFVSVPPGDTNNFWNTAKNLLNEMQACKYSPCIATFNAVLNSMRKCDLRDTVLLNRVLNEMNALGIEPTFETWNYVIQIIDNPRHPNRNMKNTILGKCVKFVFEEARTKELKVNSIEDLFFFHDAMDKIQRGLNSSELAKNLVQLRESLGSNFPGFELKDIQFYRKYLSLLTRSETAEEVMREYSKYVPSKLHPQDALFIEILDCLNVHSAYEYIPQVWEDFFTSANFRTLDVTKRIFYIMAERKYPDKIQTDFLKIADQLYNFWITSKDIQSPQRVQLLDALILGDMIEIALYAEDHEKAWTYFTELKEYISVYHKSPREKTFMFLFRTACRSEDPEKIMDVVNVMQMQGVPSLFKLINEKKEQLDTVLDENQRAQISQYWS